MHASDCSVHENFLALTFLYFFWHIHMQRSSLINTLFLSNLSSCFCLFYSMFFLVINMRPNKLHVPRLISLILKIIFYNMFFLLINMRPDKLRVSRLSPNIQPLNKFLLL
jgi:glucan phosphoethanolaminetransferase (alkaline phosphatase superfamily)